MSHGPLARARRRTPLLRAGAVVVLAVGCAGRTMEAGADAAAGNNDSGVLPSGGSQRDGSVDDGSAAIEEQGSDDGDSMPTEPGMATDAGCAYLAPPYSVAETDPHHCGTSGQDCRGGACVDGGCTPLPAAVLATGQARPIAIAADETNVYWLNKGVDYQTSHVGGGVPVEEIVGAQIMECAVEGCGNKPTILASMTGLGGIPVAPSALTIDAKNVYWTTQTSIQSCAISGCGCHPTTFVAGLTQPPAVTVAGGRVYWSVWANGSPFTGQVQSCPVGGCIGAPTLYASALGGPFGVAADTTNVYWLNTYPSGALMECALSGCDAGPSVLWSVDAGPQATDLVVDATNLYWTNAALGTVMQCAKSNCAATAMTLASGQSAPSGIAVDSSFVYWRAGKVLRCAVGGCGNNPELVATGAFSDVASDEAIAVNSTHVFWTQDGASSTDAHIMMATK